MAKKNLQHSALFFHLKMFHLKEVSGMSRIDVVGRPPPEPYHILFVRTRKFDDWITKWGLILAVGGVPRQRGKNTRCQKQRCWLHATHGLKAALNC